MINKTFLKDKNSAELTELVRQKKLVVFAGSGLSTGGGGYWSWWKLVRELCRECEVSCKDEINKQTPFNELQELAGAAKEKNRIIYTKVLKNHFARTIVDTKRAYHLLLECPFVSYVTTNYDPLFAIAYQSAIPNESILAFPEIEAKQLSQRKMFYIHGYIGEDSNLNPDKIILTKQDFESAYDRERGSLPHFWESLLREYAVLFLGCELGEPELEIIFGRCNTVQEQLTQNYGIRKRSRFILLPEESFCKDEQQGITIKQGVRQDLRDRCCEYNIKIVAYDPVDEEYSGLIDILKEWAQVQNPSVYTYTLGDN